MTVPKNQDFWQRLGLADGDASDQAAIRDRFYKKRDLLIKSGRKVFDGPDVHKIFMGEILSRANDGVRILDVGCGTGHILIQLNELMATKRLRDFMLIGTDLSEPSVEIAWANARHLANILFLRENAYSLPFPHLCFDLVISRTAPYSLTDVYCLLKERGCFLAYTQGPIDYPELSEAFGSRYTIKTPRWLERVEEWVNEEIERHKEAGFAKVEMREYNVTQYYSKEDLVDLIKFVPLVHHFDEKVDGAIIDDIEKTHKNEHGIRIQRQYGLLIAER